MTTLRSSACTAKWRRRSFVTRGDVGFAAVAEDAVAETFLVVWRRWRELPEDADRRRAWVFGVARHKMIDLQRSASTGRELAILAGTPEVGCALTRVEHLDTMERALRALPSHELAVVVLRLLHDLTPTEVADRLGCSVTTVTTRLHRARARMRAELEN